MSKTDILLTSINNFYNEEKNRTKLLNILDKTSGISLRNLEWFITNYAKKNNTHIRQPMESCSLFIAHISRVWMGTVRNYSIHFVGLRSFLISFQGQVMKFRQH